MSEEQKQKESTVDPAAKEFYTKAGRAFEENKFEEAVDMYSKAIEIEDGYASAYFNRALSFAILNKYAEATRDAEKVLDIEPESYDAPYVMGIIAEYQHDYNGAKEWYEKALSRNPNYEQASARLEQLKTKLTQESPEAAEAAEAAGRKEGDTTVVQEGQVKKVKWHKSNIKFNDVVGMANISPSCEDPFEWGLAAGGRTWLSLWYPANISSRQFLSVFIIHYLGKIITLSEAVWCLTDTTPGE